jgi:hypothetical protein
MANKKQHTMSQTEWEQGICEKILALIRSELFLDLRYLDVALSALAFQPKESIRTLATDGSCLYYSREQLLRLYPKNPLFLNRAYLHSVLHCVFRHLHVVFIEIPIRFFNGENDFLNSTICVSVSKES